MNSKRASKRNNHRFVVKVPWSYRSDFIHSTKHTINFNFDDKLKDDPLVQRVKYQRSTNSGKVHYYQIEVLTAADEMLYLLKTGFSKVEDA